MSDVEQKQLTPKDGCEECRELRDRVESARQSKSYMHSDSAGYRHGKSPSRQYKQVREQIENNENAERLARARLRLHEMQAHEGVTDANTTGSLWIA